MKNYSKAHVLLSLSLVKDCCRRTKQELLLSIDGHAQDLKCHAGVDKKLHYCTLKGKRVHRRVVPQIL